MAASRTVALLLVALVYANGSLYCCGAQETGDTAQSRTYSAKIDDVQTWILPILYAGPNNQKRDLRHAVALAKELGVGVILTGIFKHYRDTRRRIHTQRPVRPLSRRRGPGGKALHPVPNSCFSEPYHLYMPFEEVLDRDPIDEWVPTITVEELKAQGWDGKIDLMVEAKNTLPKLWYFTFPWNSSYVTHPFGAEGIGIPKGTPLLTVESPLRCEADRIKSLKDKISPYKFVAMQTIMLGYDLHFNLSEEAQGPNRTDSSKDQCHHIIHHTNGLLRPSRWIRDLARQYVREMTSIGDDSYMAVHIRPYPDKCLDLWRIGDFDKKDVRKACVGHHMHFHERVGKCVQRAQETFNASRVFVSTHPVIVNTVNMLLDKVGVKAEYMDADKLLQLSGCRDESSTFMALVEEAVAMEAEAFLGTHISTVTQTIGHERLGVGNMQNAFFEMCTVRRRRRRRRHVTRWMDGGVRPRFTRDRPGFKAHGRAV